ncbi:MAG: hypothetical protein H6695_04265 [Deferribacteres bacterium]|nr:hypothetical protein [candidate division KSB1 bacterium]MCB9509367.1 hypothetical protein [Deferribacteres bacterium]
MRKIRRRMLSNTTEPRRKWFYKEKFRRSSAKFGVIRREIPTFEPGV